MGGSNMLTQQGLGPSALLETAPDAIVGVGADGLIALVNARTERQFGYRRRGSTTRAGRRSSSTPKSAAGSQGCTHNCPRRRHEIALAMLRENYLTNEMLRQWGADRIATGQVLRDLVDQGLAVKEGGRRYARYALDLTASARKEEPDLFSALSTDSVPDVGEALRSRGEATAGELVELTDYHAPPVLNRLRTLTETGTIVAVGPTWSPKRRYRWVAPPAAD